MSIKKLIIGTRSSELALWQAKYVQKLILEKAKQLDVSLEVELQEFSTKGDQILDTDLYRIGDKGLFTQELESALLSGQIQMAVHSLKDLPTQMRPEIPLAAVLPRGNPFDGIVLNSSFEGVPILSELPQGFVLGTSSLRRIYQLRDRYPHLEFCTLRGNVNTRLSKLESNGNNISGAILAQAGLERLGLSHLVHVSLGVDDCVPAPAQGALAVQINQDLLADKFVSEILRLVNCYQTQQVTMIERELLHLVEGGCHTPFGAYARFISEDKIHLSVYKYSEGQGSIRHSQEILLSDWQKEIKCIAEIVSLS